MIREAEFMLGEAKKLTEEEATKIQLPRNFQGSQLDWMQQTYLFDELEKRQKAIAFHAGEIFQILVTGMLYGDGDFQKTMAFIVNYGRDNDTVAAVAGMILGAAIGFEDLPDDLKMEVLKVSKEVVGLDLEALAEQVYGDLKG